MLTHPEGRKTFDVYNYFSATRPDLDFLILGDGKRKFSNLYPRASWSKQGLAAQLTAHPETPFVYLPIEEEPTLDLLAKNLPDRHANLHALLPAREKLALARNKAQLAEFCHANDLPTPATFTAAEVRAPDWPFRPLIAKPAIGSGALGHVHVDRPREISKLDAIVGRDYLIQAKLPHARDVIGGFFLMRDGHEVASYGHERLRTYPPEGGVTVYSRLKFDPEIRALGNRILEKLNWSGLAMLEFLYDPEREGYQLIEINPRLWGSILLSEFSGVGLVEKYIDLALGRAITERPVRREAYIRWLVPYEGFHLLRGGWRSGAFWRLGRARTVYVNMSYASWGRSLRWHLVSMLDPSKLKKLYRKLLGR